MIRNTIALIALVVLTACSTPDSIPANDCPRQGGIGGTGGTGGTGNCPNEQQAL